MNAFRDALRQATPNERDHLVREMLRAIARHDVGDRPGRVEPAQQAPTETTAIS